MSTISTQVRNFKDPTKDQLLHAFFSIYESTPMRCSKDGEKSASSGDLDKMEINAVLTLGEPGVEDAYVSLQASVLRCPIIKYGILEITLL